MDHSTSLKRAIIAVAAIAFLFISTLELRAQTTYKRGAIFEEFTGIWCPHCPPGAWALDTLQEKYGDNLVEIAWHGGPSVPGSLGYDPLWLRPHDTLYSFFGANGWPTGLYNRAYKGGFGITLPQYGDYPVWVVGANNPGLMESVLNAKPVVDFRMVNLTYDPGTRIVAFDVDVTPYDMTKMRSDDTTTYSTIALLTEDNVLETQANYGDWDKVPAGDLEDFHEMNVVRIVGGGAVIGNTFVLGTKTPTTQTLPIRVHYSMKVNANWNADMIRAKTFPQALFPKNGKSISLDVLDAKQTGYVTSLPQTATDAEWVVLPNAASTLKATAPINIVWASAGAASPNAKLEYSIDGGSTWSLVTASTNKSPFAWTIPQDAFGKTAKIRISDAANAGTSGVSESFKIPAAPIVGSLAVIKPAAGEVLTGGTVYTITLTESNLVTPIKFDYSIDGGITWTSAGTPLSIEGSTFKWTVENTDATTNAIIRVSDNNGVTGKSGVFTINKGAVGVLSAVKVKDVDANKNIPSSMSTTISWTAVGDVGAGLLVQYSSDNYVWNTVTNGSVLPTATSLAWTTPPVNVPTAYIRVISLDADKQSASAQYGPFTVGAAAGVAENSVNGYSISNYPNPFSGETTIKFEMPKSGSVTLLVRDELGREISKIITENLEAGSHSIPFNATKLSNGIYTYTLEAGETKLVGKMSVVK